MTADEGVLPPGKSPPKHPSRRNRALGAAALGRDTGAEEPTSPLDLEMELEDLEDQDAEPSLKHAPSTRPPADGDASANTPSSAPSYAAPTAVAGFDALTKGEHLWMVGSVVLELLLCALGLYLGLVR